MAFFERLLKDAEFREWFVVQPSEALASQGLGGESLQDLYGILEWGGPHQQTASTLRPLVDFLVKCWEGGGEVDPVVARERYEYVTGLIEALKGRPELAEEVLGESRPWWKFWEW